MIPFLRALFSGLTEGCVTLWTLPGKESLHVPVQGLLSASQADVAELEQMFAGRNVYFGTGVRRDGLDAETRGKKSDVICLPCFSLDIDLRAPGAHKADNLPETLEDADWIVADAPTPTAVVHTGNGLHLHWRFEEPYMIESTAHRKAVEKAFENFQRPFIKRAAERGWHLDLTATVDRVWRIPGFLNVKREPHALVETLLLDLKARIPTPSQYKPPKPEPTPTAITPRLDEIPESTIAKLKALRDPERKKAFAAIFEGKSFAKPGERDTALQRVCSTLAFADEGKTKPDVLVMLLFDSLKTWADEPDAEKTHEEELEKAFEKLTRATDDWAKHNAKHRAELEPLRAVLKNQTEPDFKHLTLQKDNLFFVYSFERKAYCPGHTSRELPLVIRDAWPEGSPVELTYTTEKGKVVKKPMASVLDEYGTVIEGLTYSLYRDTAQYDPSMSSLTVPTAPRRAVKPVYHEEIDRWLRLMPAREHHVEMFLDWLSTITNLDRMSAALYLSGPKSTGKSLLVGGAARLWIHGASNLRHVFSRFNDSLLRCPLVNADELWRKQDTNICGELRELVGNMAHQIEQKGRDVATLEGAVRLIITANNETLLNTKGNGYQNTMEREATIERILHVPTQTAAADYLKTIPGRWKWRDNNLIAEHLLWLKQERAQGVIDRALEQGHRFLIQGDPTDADFYDGIGSQPRDFDSAVIWLSHVINAKVVPPPIRDMIRIEHGKFFVVPRAVCASWKLFSLNETFETPTSSNQASRLLRPFIEARTKMGEHNAYKIDLVRFSRAVLNEGLVSKETLAAKLGIG